MRQAPTRKWWKRLCKSHAHVIKIKMNIILLQPPHFQLQKSRSKLTNLDSSPFSAFFAFLHVPRWLQNTLAHVTAKPLEITNSVKLRVAWLCVFFLYALRPNKRTCYDIDECQAPGGNTVLCPVLQPPQRRLNRPWIWQANLKTGVRILCPANTFCHNTQGGYECIDSNPCSKNYTLTSHSTCTRIPCYSVLIKWGIRDWKKTLFRPLFRPQG